VTDFVSLMLSRADIGVQGARKEILYLFHLKYRT